MKLIILFSLIYCCNLCLIGNVEQYNEHFEQLSLYNSSICIENDSLVITNNNKSIDVQLITIYPINYQPIIDSINSIISITEKKDNLISLKNHIEHYKLKQCLFMMQLTETSSYYYYFFCMNEQEKFKIQLSKYYIEMIINYESYLDIHSNCNYENNPILYSEGKSKEVASYLTIEKEGLVIKKDIEMTKPSSSFRYEQIVNCIGKTNENDECCYSLDVEWNNKDTTSIICSRSRENEQCKYEIKLIRSSIYKECIKSHVDSMYNIFIVHKNDKAFIPKDIISLKKISEMGKQIKKFNLEQSIKDDHELREKIIRLKGLLLKQKNTDNKTVPQSKDKNTDMNNFKQSKEDKIEIEKLTQSKEVPKSIGQRKEKKRNHFLKAKRKLKKSIQGNEDYYDIRKEQLKEDDVESNDKNITIINMFPKRITKENKSSKVDLLSEVNANINSYSRSRIVNNSEESKKPLLEVSPYSMQKFFENINQYFT